MQTSEIAIIGAGPAGLCAAVAAAEMGAQVTLIERNSRIGGQLIKQTQAFFPLQAQKVIVATGASEKTLAFPNNDLPGVYGAGTVQTLRNVHGVMPGKRVLMVGSGNVGLIVSYQLLQAGVEVTSLIEAAPNIGGYLVHAAKLRRIGFPYLLHIPSLRPMEPKMLRGLSAEGWMRPGS